MQMDDLASVLYTPEDLDKMVAGLAEKIDEDYAGQEVVIAVTLKGALVIAADLIRKLKKCHVYLDTIAASSYGDATISSGEVKIRKELDTDIAGKNVILVEDIVDSGITMHALLPILLRRGAASVKLCSLLSKPSRRKVEIAIDYLGAEVPDEFLVGYGLDYAQSYRNLPCIGVLKREIYS